MTKMNMSNFKKILKKASVSYLIPGVSLEFDGEWITSNAISPDNNTIVFLKVKNDILQDIKDEQFEFNFSDVSQNLKPYIDLIRDDEVNTKIEQNMIVINDSQKKKYKLFFCGKDFTSHFSGKDPSGKLDWFYDSIMTQTLLEQFNEIKKVALKFGKVYFVVEKGKLYIESTDKTNSFCNSVRVEIDDFGDKDFNVSMYFDFKNLSYILNTIENNITDYRIKCTYSEDQEAGMILFVNKDETEKYFLTSKTE